MGTCTPEREGGLIEIFKELWKLTAVGTDSFPSAAVKELYPMAERINYLDLTDQCGIINTVRVPPSIGGS